MKTYASFFERHDKGQKELGVVEELIVALNNGAGLHLHSPSEFVPDPPDCVCSDGAGRPVAIEVTEIVCEQAVRLNAQGKNVYRHWQPGELTQHIASTLAEKDTKTFSGGPYKSIIAALFTDEPALALAQAKAELDLHVFGPYRQLTAAYLLFSYQPESRSYPVLTLRLLS
jgi:hypothetical protein